MATFYQMVFLGILQHWINMQHKTYGSQVWLYFVENLSTKLKGCLKSFSPKKRCALVMLKVHYNSVPKMDFRCMLEGFPQVSRTWGGDRWVSSKFDGGRLESIHGGSWGALKWCSENLRKILEKYLWRRSFVCNAADYKPVILLKMNFFIHIFLGF